MSHWEPMNLFSAAKVGDEEAVRELLAAGADVKAVNRYGWLPIHWAARCGHAGIMQLLMKVAPATLSMVGRIGRTPLHTAASFGHTAVAQLLLEAAPGTSSCVTNSGETPLHMAVRHGHIDVVRMLATAAPAAVNLMSIHGKTPLDFALVKGAPGLRSVCCLVRAAPTVQPTLRSLVKKGPRAATLYADLVSRLALTQQQWQSIPAPCPDLARALPAVTERSVAEAGWLVGRLELRQRARLRAAAVILARGKRGLPSLPAELSERILVAAMVAS